MQRTANKCLPYGHVGARSAFDFGIVCPQCVSMCFSVVQCGAVCSRVLQCVAVCCSVLQCDI